MTKFHKKPIIPVIIPYNTLELHFMFAGPKSVFRNMTIPLFHFFKVFFNHSLHSQLISRLLMY